MHNWRVVLKCETKSKNKKKCNKTKRKITKQNFDPHFMLHWLWFTVTSKFSSQVLCDLPSCNLVWMCLLESVSMPPKLVASLDVFWSPSWFDWPVQNIHFTDDNGVWQHPTKIRSLWSIFYALLTHVHLNLSPTFSGTVSNFLVSYEFAEDSQAVVYL